MKLTDLDHHPGWCVRHDGASPAMGVPSGLFASVSDPGYFRYVHATGELSRILTEVEVAVLLTLPPEEVRELMDRRLK